MTPTDLRVRELGADELPEATAVLCEAFRDYPVMRFVLGEEGDYDGRLHALVGFFAGCRVLRAEPVLGVRDGDRLLATALVSCGDGRRSPPEVATLRASTWDGLGDASLHRYEAFGRATASFGPAERHHHLNMIGVRDGLRGRGVGRALMDAVHALAAGAPWSAGVSLTTEDPANVPLYEHLGYARTGTAEVEGGLRSWGFFRPADRGGEVTDG